MSLLPVTVRLAEVSTPSARKPISPMSNSETRVRLRVCLFPCIAMRHVGLDLSASPFLVHVPRTYEWLRVTSKVQASFSHTVASSRPLITWILFTKQQTRNEEDVPHKYNIKIKMNKTLKQTRSLRAMVQTSVQSRARVSFQQSHHFHS